MSPHEGGAWGTIGIPMAGLSDSTGGHPVFLPLDFLSSLDISGRLPSSLAVFPVLSQKDKNEHDITKGSPGALEEHTCFQLSLQRAIWIL